jgi:hypothetical protein
MGAAIKRGIRQVWAIIGFCLLLQAVNAAGASAYTDHVFDPNLSLTGGTAVSAADPTPDPPPNHPEQAFSFACGAAADSHGNVYIASRGGAGEAGRIDVFDPAGRFLLEIDNENAPCRMAVDDLGTLYVLEEEPARRLVRYTPSAFPPTSTVSYGSSTVVAPEPGSFEAPIDVAVNRGSGHVFVAMGDHVNEYGSVAEDNALLRSDIGQGTVGVATEHVAVDSTTGDIFVGTICTDCFPIPGGEDPFVSVVYVFSASGVRNGEINGSDLPHGGFASAFGQVDPAIDEETGEVFVADNAAHRVFRFVPAAGAGEYEYLPDPELEDHFYSGPLSSEVANGPQAPNRGNVYIAVSQLSSHVFAFAREGETGAPLVSGTTFDGITTDEAVVRAEINPHGVATSYHFEYVDDVTFRENVEQGGAGHGFDRALSTAATPIGAGSQSVSVSEALIRLNPGTVYHFRVVASNCIAGEEGAQCLTEGEREEEGHSAEVPHVFATFADAPLQSPCANQSLRTGPSARLPDCRAFELVTPPDTNGREPSAGSMGLSDSSFETQLTSGDGESLLFMTPGGALPGTEGNGIQDGYEARRTAAGWQISHLGPSGAQSQSPLPGGASADHGFWFWRVGSGADRGSLVVPGSKFADYVREPSGDFRLIGEAPFSTDAAAQGRWIAPGGTHLIFTSRVPLAEGAPPAGTLGIYDRTPDGVTHAISLLPGGITPGTDGVPAEVSYGGASADGSAVAFEVAEGGVSTLYLSRDGATVAVSSGENTFAGLSADGRRLTYVRAGNIFSFDAVTGASAQVGSGGKSTPVNVSADGSHVYFVSPKVLVAGKAAVASKDNFYVWDAEANSLSFIAVLEHLDVTGGPSDVYGLGLWTEGLGPLVDVYNGPANDPSRTTPDGRFIVFESRSNLTGYEGAGFTQVYRYDAESEQLSCLSCNPTLAAATSDAHLQLVSQDPDDAGPTSAITPVRNIADDGKRVFFQSREALVPADVNRALDVYEWEAAGTGGCRVPSGCLSLISSGHSGGPSYLYAATPSGDDVFFTTSDQLVGADRDGARSIFDARVNGGFAEPVAVPCAGESCREQSTPAPSFSQPGTLTQGSSGNVSSKKACKKVQRRDRRKVRRCGRPCRRKQQGVRRKSQSKCPAKAHERHRRGGSQSR